MADRHPASRNPKPKPKAPKKPRAEPPRCQFVSPEDKPCIRFALRGKPFCYRHHQTDPAEMREANALGGPEIVDQIKQELGIAQPAEHLETLPAPPTNPADVIKARQAAAKPPVQEKAKPTPHPSVEVTEVVKHRLAEQKLAAEQKKKLRELRRLGINLPATPMTKTVARRPGLPDPSYVPLEMLNKDKEGRYWIPRWIYTQRPDGQPRYQRLADFKMYGSEPVLGNSKIAEKLGRPDLGGDGKPVKGHLGELWQVPVDGAADRIIDKSQTGAFNIDDVVNRMQDQAEQINSAMGRDAVGVVWAGEDHGDRTPI